MAEGNLASEEETGMINPLHAIADAAMISCFESPINPFCSDSSKPQFPFSL